MPKLSRFATATAAAALSAFSMGGPAQAADLGLRPMVEPAPFYDWSGAYIGGLVAHSWFTAIAGIDPQGDGFHGGGLVGWNAQTGNIVYGMEGDVTFGKISGSYGPTSVSLNPVSTIRARLGYAFDNVLLYATGGLAIADAEYEREDDGFVGPDGPLFGSDSQLLTGYTVGGGVEWRSAGGFGVRGEYLFTEFGTKDFDIQGGSTPVDFKEMHTVRAALIYHLPPLF